MPISFRPQAAVAMLGVSLVLAVLATTGGVASHNSQAHVGDTYVEAMIDAPRFVNPLLASSDTDTDLAHLVFSGLTRVDEQGNIAPDLADGWQVSPDGRVYMFTLKPGLRWQDGEALTSDDVLFTLDLLRDEAFPGDPALAAPWRGVRVEVPNRHTVRCTLASSDASFLQFTTLGVLPSHAWANIKSADMPHSDLNQNPVGSGPWRYVRGGSPATNTNFSGADNTEGTPVVEREEGVLLEPNPYYVGHRPADIARLWFRLYPTFGAALTGFKMGEVHGLGHIPAERLDEVASVPGVTLRQQTLARYTMLLMNLRSPLFDKPETRQAMQLAIDSEALVRQSLGGQARVTQSPVLPQSWAYSPPANPHGYDQAEARRLLDRAGWVIGEGGVRARNGVTMTVVLAANADLPANVAMSNQIASYLRDVGVDVKLALVSRDVLLRDYLGPRAFHMALAGWEAQGADPDLYDYWHSSQANIQGGLNFSGWSNKQADAALQTARTATDKNTRKRAYADFQQAFYQDTPAVILDTPLYTYATRAPASGVTLPSTDMLSPAYRFDTIKGWSLR